MFVGTTRQKQLTDQKENVRDKLKIIKTKLLSALNLPITTKAKNMHALIDYIFFLLKTLTLVAAILLAAAGFLAIVSKNKKKSKGQLIVKKLNNTYEKTKNILKQACQNDEEYKNWLKEEKKKDKEKKKQNKENIKKNIEETAKSRLFVLDFKGDIRASQSSALAHEIDAIILNYQAGDEVLLRLESPGGMVHCYGLASSQLNRLREKEIPLTIAVDKVAASGGYMMAAVANKVVAAPFAIIGSIGVLAQIPNFHRLLEHNRIDFEQLTAGQYKRTLTMLGKNTAEDRKKMQEDLEETHILFQDHLQHCRPQLDMQQVATGEHWYGLKAIELKLIDKIQTSDDLILEALKTQSIYHLQYKEKLSLSQRLASASEQSLQNIRLWMGYAGTDITS